MHGCIMILRFKCRKSYSDKFKTANEVMRGTISAKFVGKLSLTKLLLNLLCERFLLHATDG